MIDKLVIGVWMSTMAAKIRTSLINPNCPQEDNICSRRRSFPKLRDALQVSLLNVLFEDMESITYLAEWCTCPVYFITSVIVFIVPIKLLGCCF